MYRLYGDYETLGHCEAADALVDFTGGVPEKLVLKELNLGDQKAQKTLFIELKESLEDKALITCRILVSSLVLQSILS